MGKMSLEQFLTSLD